MDALSESKYYESAAIWDPARYADIETARAHTTIAWLPPYPIPYCEDLEAFCFTCSVCGCRFHRTYHMCRFDRATMMQLFPPESGMRLMQLDGGMM